MPGSGIREIFNLAVGRDDVLHLEVGEPDFPTPPHVVEAAVQAARRGVGYTQTAGLLELREAIAEKLKRVNGLDYAPNQILVTQGGAEAIAVLFAAIVSPGDEVLLPDPAWPNLNMLAVLSESTPVFYAGTDRGVFRLWQSWEIAGTRPLVFFAPSHLAYIVFWTGRQASASSATSR